MPKRMKNQNTYVHGSHNELCDVCGFKFKTEDMHTRWDGARTCHDDYEERHPMDFFRSTPDDQTVGDPSADDTDNSGVNTTLPSISGTITNQENFQGDTITPVDVSTAFTEGDGSSAAYKARGLPAGLYINVTTGIISGTINSLASANSPYTVTITLTTAASLLYYVETSFTWTVKETGPSSIVSWIEGTGSPTIDGPIYTSATASAAVNDTVASTINTIDSDTGKYYAEFDITVEGTNPVALGAGWKRTATLADASAAQMPGVWWDSVVTEWKVQVSTLGNSSTAFTVQPDAPSATTKMGVALDCSANKIYIMMDGEWMTSTSGTVGGDPSSGNGWDVTNPAQIVALYSFTQADNQTIQASKPQYTPAGYTEVT